MLPDNGGFNASEMQQQPPAVAMPSPEVMSSVDETNFKFAPNLASNQELCKAVLKHLIWDYWYIYETQQQQFWPAWKRIDDAWRSRVSVADLNIESLTQKTREQIIQTLQDGMSAKGQSPAIFKQIKAITDLGEQVSWQDGIPCRAEVPADIFEHPLYQPNQQSAEAVNSILEDTADKKNVRSEYRKSFGGFVKYGCGWGLNDFSKMYEDMTLRYRLSQNPMEQQVQVEALSQEHKSPPSTVQMGQDGPEAIFVIKRIKEMGTDFKHIDIDSVFIDPLLPVDDMSKQPAPFVREHINKSMLFDCAYDEENNPMGYLNLDKVDKVNASHYVLSQADEGPLWQRLRHRYNLSDSITNSTSRMAVKQKWTCFPLLRINENNGELDTGEGTVCHHCKGSGNMDVMPYSDSSVEFEGVQEQAQCQECEGSGRVHPPLKRYVVSIFGGLLTENVCLRIQEWPKGMRLPLQYAGDMIEDTACAYPMSKSEIAIPINEQLATAATQFEQCKNQSINRGWKVKEDSPAASIQNFNKPDQRIPFENDPNEAMRVENNNFDETITLMPYMQMKESQIVDIYGASAAVLGEISSGRRSALEIGNAIESSKNPLINTVDRFNKQMMGGWAARTVENLDLFGDRDWILKKTGKSFFGKFRFFTAVGNEFVKKMAAIQNLQTILQSSANDPVVQPQRAELWNQAFNLMGIKNIKVNDGGIQKSIQEAMTIVTTIVGDGLMIPPSPDDPDDIYIGAFQQAMKDPYWITHAPQNLPLLQQRLFMQQQQAQQKAMEQAMQQQQQMMAEMQMQGGGEQQPNAKRTSQDMGQFMQDMQGTAAPQPNRK